ncbi:CLUMA_CG010314, isoform B [Clunio marinus]|uniref:CLUMA_CG010314, isoform B n=1 Tax=Clunio marinus TaxID=568069 RepID=A0A1J1IB46_9DIPT|nr:CLUMA_CG010314, isoform B [Clunio marinus]
MINRFSTHQTDVALSLSTINQIQCTCVLESDFGFSLNCNFKKAGLFRVRNLGGVKAHFGLGFSVGDELGFPESLGNVEGSRRRALNLRTGGNTLGVLPGAKMPVKKAVPKLHQSRPQAVTTSHQMIQMQTMVPRPMVSTPQGFRKPNQMTEATSLPLGVPAFKPIPRDTINVSGSTTKMTSTGIAEQETYDNNQKSYRSVPSFSSKQTQHSRISFGQEHRVGNEIQQPIAQPLVQTFENEELPQVDLKGHTVEELATAANVSVEVIQTAIKMRQQQMLLEKRNYANTFNQRNDGSHATIQTTPTTIIRTTPTTTTARTTTTRYVPKTKVTRRRIAGGHKVMNAPKEYYPVGYDKNFDDNFKSKVDLPATTFHCGDQKHFPGLYADEDLGCMVFHVCALTDDGLIMKSFLCPESTLFDQTILKCNWWFYTDCKSSKSLYDSNLPVSKSYQLMKSLAFFNSNYKKPGNGTADAIDNGIDVEALSNSFSSKRNL